MQRKISVYWTYVSSTHIFSCPSVIQNSFMERRGGEKCTESPPRPTHIPCAIMRNTIWRVGRFTKDRDLCRASNLQLFCQVKCVKIFASTILFANGPEPQADSHAWRLNSPDLWQLEKEKQRTFTKKCGENTGVGWREEPLFSCLSCKYFFLNGRGNISLPIYILMLRKDWIIQNHCNKSSYSLLCITKPC